MKERTASGVWLTLVEHKLVQDLLALPCPALPCPALPCPALRGLARPCPILPPGTNDFWTGQSLVVSDLTLYSVLAHMQYRRLWRVEVARYRGIEVSAGAQLSSSSAHLIQLA